MGVNQNTKTAYTGTAKILIEPITWKVDVMRE
jgi:hypothetical protein